MPRGWRRGFCWWLLAQGITKIRVGNTEIPVIPGTGVGRLVAWAAISQNLGQTNINQNEINALREQIKMLEEEIRKLEERLKKITQQ